MDNIRNYREKLSELKGQRNQAIRMLEEEKKINDRLSQDFLDAEMASDIIYEVSKKTQEGLSFKIENIVNMALEYVLDNPYKFKVDFDISNNNTQCNLKYIRNGHPLNPLKDSEGTALDPTSVALRLALWSLPEERTSPVLILDECFKHVSKGMRARATKFLKEMCNKMGLQIITVSHDETAIEGADKLFKINIKNNKSFIEEII